MERQDDRSLLQTGACSCCRCWCGRDVTTFSLTRQQTGGITFIPSGFFFFLEMLKYSQSVWYYGLLMRRGSLQWAWGASKILLKITATSDSSTTLDPKCCRQTRKWRMMIINAPIRHLLCFQACLESNVFTIKELKWAKKHTSSPLMANVQQDDGLGCDGSTSRLWLFGMWRPREPVMSD